VNGYTFFFALAQDIASGRGLNTAFRVPLYPMLLAALTGGRMIFWTVLVAQSVIGAGTVWGAGVLAGEMFGPESATIAAGITAVYPYYVVHDTALQETSLFTLLTLASVIGLRKAWGGGSVAGLLLALDVLTRATIAPFAALAPLLLPRKAAIACGAVLLLGISPWLLHSYRLTGSPVLTTETGMQVWDGNNPYSFSYYPERSMDLSKAAAFDALTATDRAELDALADNEVVRDRWFLRKGLTYIRAHPWLTVGNGFRKVVAAFGWLPSPRRGSWQDLVYAASYGPVMVLGVSGMWMRRKHWREDAAIYLLFLSFIVVTGLFFGHTSHRSYLDVYWIVFAAGFLARNRYFPASRSARAGP
jgi:hypothetical protein